jgi:hypothetical protein
MSSSKKDRPNLSSLNDLPMNSAIQSTIIVAVKEVVNEDANPSISCARCREEDDGHSDAVQYCQDCQLPLCDTHAILHQKNKKIKDHALVPAGNWLWQTQQMCLCKEFDND